MFQKDDKFALKEISKLADKQRQIKTSISKLFMCCCCEVFQKFLFPILRSSSLGGFIEKNSIIENHVTFISKIYIRPLW